MSAGSSSPTSEVFDRTGIDDAQPRRHRWPVLLAALMVAALAVAATAVVVRTRAGQSKSGAAGNVAGASLATVTRQTLESQQQVDGTLGYAGTFSVVNRSGGTITALPAVGQTVAQGQALYQVDGSPVTLLYGGTPAYRSLGPGDTGPDVAELNADLVAMGDASTAQLSPRSDAFGDATVTALEKVQRNLGVPVTGSLAIGSVVFLPGAARISSVDATLAASAPPGQEVLKATSTTRQVAVQLDATQQSDVAVGDQVTITLPNHQTTPGTVSSVGKVATAGQSGSGSSSSSSGSSSSGSSTSTIQVLIAPTDPAATGSLDAAPVQVAITTASVKDALVVPVTALLATSSGYELEVVSAKGRRHLEKVTLGLFDDAAGLVQVSGSGLAAGQRVVVPS
jgi:hypothetical protein